MNEEQMARLNNAIEFATGCINALELINELNECKENLADMTALYSEADDERIELRAICIANGWNPDSNIIGKSEV
jgi:hypothetical protein